MCTAHKLFPRQSVVAKAYNLSSKESRAGRPQVQGYHGVHDKFQHSLGYMMKSSLLKLLKEVF